jgi:superfamily II DNA or RNA helicase
MKGRGVSAVPTIFDNIERKLLDALRETLRHAYAADFCVGYLNLRGWGRLADAIDHFDGTDDRCCRILIGMHRPPEEEMREAQRAIRRSIVLDGPTVARLKRKVTESFKEQLTFGVPTNEAEIALRKLARQLRSGKVRVKLFLRYPLHAKLYLVHRTDPITPLIGYLGSSNLTLAGLSEQGELNVDVVDQDAAQKLLRWFEERWNDEFTLDISDELAHLIETSWAREDLVLPYHVYLKMAYHLCEEARKGEREFKLPKVFQGVLLDFQAAAVSLAAYYLHRRGGVLLGDVVGLGKTLMATAIAKIFQEDDGSNILIICPPKLQEMWQQHVERYQLVARVLSLGRVINKLPNLPRYRLVIIDESHNLRNREGKRYRAIRDYIEQNEPRVLLITATPYNKHFTDLSNQLRLFVDEDADLHIRPERFFQMWSRQGYTETDFAVRFQCSPRSLRAFEQSPFPEDWRDLMRLFLVRRTRQFIMRHYAQFDEERQRYFVTLNGERSYFPIRQPRTIKFDLNENDPSDQYARLYRDEVAAVIEDLALPRYGLANYLIKDAERLANERERKIINNLNRAGRRLIGFCRTNLFKRLESSGFSFLLSVERHILRNMVTLYALENSLPIPIGTQEAAMLDTAISDTEVEFLEEDGNESETVERLPEDEWAYTFTDNLDAYRARAKRVYEIYRTEFPRRFAWLDPKFFTPRLKNDLLNDAEALLTILRRAEFRWQPDRDAKLDALYRLLTETHPNDKVLVFTQFADTANYLGEQLQRRGLADLAVVTSQTPNPVAFARRFSPESNGGLKAGETELRILIATDVLAEGQNLQDAFIVVNYDLPWAIIRLIQRAGRVDRIGQKHDTILVYSFLPAEGVERIIRLRQRLLHRLQQNQEVIGTDESFFGEEVANKLRDLYTEKAGVLDEDEDEDVDLASIALQVWNSASAHDQKVALALPPIVSATRPLPRKEVEGEPPYPDPPGVIAYLRFPDGTDALVRVDEKGNLVSQSLVTVFRAAACAPDTPALPRAENHHELVAKAVQLAVQEQIQLGGQLGSLRSIRRKVYERLRRYRDHLRQNPTLFSADLLQRLETVMDAIFRFPLKESARETLGRQLRLGITDENLADLVIRLHQEDRLCQPTEETEPSEPQIICSLGLRMVEDVGGEEDA